jgi:hypothetical protein
MAESNMNITATSDDNGVRVLVSHRFALSLQNTDVLQNEAAIGLYAEPVKYTQRLHTEFIKKIPLNNPLYPYPCPGLQRSFLLEFF